MKHQITLAGVFLFASMLLPYARGQTQTPITVPASTCSVGIDVANKATIGIQITGSWSGTIQPEVSIQGQTAVNVQVTPSTSSTAQSTITANGIYTATVSGYDKVFLCGNTISSGTASAYFNVTQTSSLGRNSSSGGSFTAANDLSGTNSSQTVIGINSTLLSGLATGLLRNTTTTGVPSIATAAQILAACTGCAPLASPTFTGTVTLPLLSTTTNCSAAGSAANPSVAACTAAPSGAFSCSTSASTGTCQVTSTAVTANSNVWVQPTGATAVGTRLSVTCNTTADTGLVAPRVSAIASGSFTINLGTFSSNPECFMFGVTD